VEKLTRIKLGSIKALFASVNKKPKKGLSGEDSVCVVNALELSGEYLNNQYYFKGVIDGWDDDSDNFISYDKLEYKLGFADGQAAWKEVNE
jgi:hypothetical protein